MFQENFVTLQHRAAAISRSRAPHLTRLQQDRINFGNLGTVGFRDLTTCNVDLEI